MRDGPVTRQLSFENYYYLSFFLRAAKPAEVCL